MGEEEVVNPEQRQISSQRPIAASAQESSLQCAAYIGGDHGRCPNPGLRKHDEISEDGTGHGVWISWCDLHWLYYHPEEAARRATA